MAEKNNGTPKTKQGSNVVVHKNRGSLLNYTRRPPHEPPKTKPTKKSQ